MTGGAHVKRAKRPWNRRPIAWAVLPVLAMLALVAPSGPVAGTGPIGRRAVPAASPTAEAAPVAAATGARHTVVAGETLSGIAVAHGVTVSALVGANGVADPDLIRIGTVLTIPAASTSTASSGSGVGLPERLQASPTRQAYIPIFEQWAAANGIPADLLMAMTWLESGWQNHTRSSTGAVGIGQLMPDTVEFMEALIGRDLDPHLVDDNIRMSARYLRWLLARYDGDPAQALAAYYQGPASVERSGTFAETDTYVANVLALRSRF